VFLIFWTEKKLLELEFGFICLILSHGANNSMIIIIIIVTSPLTQLY